VEIKLYDIIYNVITDVRAAMEGLLEPEYKEVVQGRAEVRELFKVPKVGTIAGCYVTDGKIMRSNNLKLVRDSVVVFDGKILSLKRFKDDARKCWPVLNAVSALKDLMIFIWAMSLKLIILKTGEEIRAER